MAEHVPGYIHGITGQGDSGTTLHVSDDSVHREGQELAKDDHHLIRRDKETTQPLGSSFAEEDGNRRGSATNRKPKDDTRQVEDPDVRGNRAADGAKQEDDGEQRDVMAATKAVGEASAEERTGGSTDAQQAADPAFFEGGHVQTAGASGHVHVGQGASDNAGVIAEEERAKRRDDSNCAQGALRTGSGGLLDELAHPVGRVVVNRWSVCHMVLLCTSSSEQSG